MIFKRYNNGKVFYTDNSSFLNAHLFSKMQTAFFKGNSMRVLPTNSGSYAFTIEDENRRIVFLREQLFDSLLYGDASLAYEAGRYAAQYDGEIRKILGEEASILAFSKIYSEMRGYTYSILQQMSILYLNKLTYQSSRIINSCQKEDFESLVPFIISFYKEALNEVLTKEMAIDFLNENYKNLFYAKSNDKIISMAMYARSEEQITAISHVYTDVNYRGQGYAKEVVSFLAVKLLEMKKIPYLYVDKANPISNHLYRTLGFEHVCDQIKVVFH